MVDAVRTQVITDTGIRYEVLLTNVSDGTGESYVRKVDLSDLTYIGTDQPPSSLDVESVHATVRGFSNVTLYWDRAPDPKVLCVCPSGHTELTFKPPSILKDVDRGQQGSTGDILLTTGAYDTDGNFLMIDATATSTYVIKIRFRLRK